MNNYNKMMCRLFIKCLIIMVLNSDFRFNIANFCNMWLNFLKVWSSISILLYRELSFRLRCLDFLSLRLPICLNCMILYRIRQNIKIW